MMTQSLLQFRGMAINNYISIVKLSDKIIYQSHEDDLKYMIELIGENYPGIDIWFKKKALQGIKDQNRFAYLVYYKEKPAGCAVIRITDRPKLCSFRILPELREKGLGQLIMALLAREVRHCKGDIFFTIPESRFEEYGRFFEDYGFKCKGKAKKQYRSGDTELLCIADFPTLWEHSLSSLQSLTDKFRLIGNPKIPDLVMSIHPEHATKILDGTKTVEIRRKINKSWEGAYIMIYATAPQREFVGEARIDAIIHENPTDVWSKFKREVGISKEQFDKYCQGKDTVCAIILNEVTAYKHPISKIQIDKLLGKEISSPQSYAIAKPSSNWPTAIRLGYLLQA